MNEVLLNWNESGFAIYEEIGFPQGDMVLVKS